MVLSWAGLFAFLPVVSTILYEEGFGDRWRLANLWYCMRTVGRWCFGILRPNQAEQMWEIAGLLIVIAAICAAVLWPRVRAVQVVQ